MLTRRSFLRPALPLAAALLAGCGRPAPNGRKPVYPVRGKVMMNGRPAHKARVVLHPLGDPDPRAVRPHGEAGPDGTFRLSTYRSDDGAPAGEYAVTVTWPDAGRGPADEAPDRLKGRYADPKRPAWKVRVEARETEFDVFTLRSH